MTNKTSDAIELVCEAHFSCSWNHMLIIIFFPPLPLVVLCVREKKHQTAAICFSVSLISKNKLSPLETAFLTVSNTVDTLHR